MNDIRDVLFVWEKKIDTRRYVIFRVNYATLTETRIHR